MAISSEPRLDARDKVVGRARFAEDLPEPQGLLFAASIRSPYSHARLRSIDSSAAEGLPGVAGVIHRDRLEGLNIHRQASSIHQELFADDKVRFDGELVGLVAAEDLRTARTAAQMVEVAYEPLPPVFSYAEAMASGAALIHEELGHNVAVTDSLEWGDVEESFRHAAQIVEGSYYSPSVYHHPMEPASSFIVWWRDGMLEAWAPLHKLFDNREWTANLLGLEHQQVRIHVPWIGGSFGGKDVNPPELNAAAALSIKLGRPIKFVATGEESFRVNARHAMTYRARMGLSESGDIIALDVELELDTGAYLTGAKVVTDNAMQSAMGGYRVPNVRVRAQTAYTNKVPAATFRSTGRSQTTFGLESLVDAGARALGMDAVEIRVRNLVLRGESLSPATRRHNGVEEPSDWWPMDTDLADILRSAVSALDGPLERGEGTRVRGRGVAMSFRRSSRSGDADAALRLEPDGTITVLHNACDLGEGSHTMLQIVTAEALGVPRAIIRVAEPDTANELFFTGVASQRTTNQLGTAVISAAGELRERVLTAVAGLHESAPSAWQLLDGQLLGPEGARVTLLELASSIGSAEQLEGRGYFRTKEARATLGPGRDHWTAGAAAAEIEVDRATGEIRLLRHAATADAGHVLHYPSAKGQVEGGAVLGFGLGMFEELLYQEGQLLNADPFQYRLPGMPDMPPEFSVDILEKGDGPGPFGSKAMAQTSVPCVVPAVANAFYDATSKRLTEAPFTPERVLRTLEQI